MDADFHLKIVLLCAIYGCRHAIAVVYLWRSENNPVVLVPSSPFTSRHGSQVLGLTWPACLSLSHPVGDSTECFSGKTVCVPWLFVDSTLELETSFPLLQGSKQAFSEYVLVSPTLRFSQRKNFNTEAGAQLTRREHERLVDRQEETRTSRCPFLGCSVSWCNFLTCL